MRDKVMMNCLLVMDNEKPQNSVEDDVILNPKSVYNK